MSFLSNLGDAFSEVGDFCSDGWECIKNGNVLDGLGNWAMGAADAIGNTVTLGGAHALGESISDTAPMKAIGETLGEYKLGEEERNEKCAQGWKDAQGYWALAGDHFKNGNIFGGIYSGTMGCLTNIGNGITLGQAGKWGEDLASHIDYDAVGDGVHFKSDYDPWFGEKILARIAKGNADSEILQENCEAAGKVGYANLMGFVDCGSLALDVYTGASLGHLVMAPLSQIGKEGLKQGVKIGTKEVVKDVTAAGAKEATKVAVKEGIYITGKQWAKKTIGTALVAASVGQICSAEVNDIKKNGLGHQVTKQIDNVAGDAKELIDDVGDSLSWLARHPFIARTVNTAKGIGDATVATLGSKKIVSNTAAWGKKFFDFQHQYDGVSTTEIAEEIRRHANEGNKSFMETYVDSVKKNDAKVKLDARDRLFVGNMVDGGKSAGDAEPSSG
jgi:hypothetical protein